MKVDTIHDSVELDQPLSLPKDSMYTKHDTMMENKMLAIVSSVCVLDTLTHNTSLADIFPSASLPSVSPELDFQQPSSLQSPIAVHKDVSLILLFSNLLRLTHMLRKMLSLSQLLLNLSFNLK